MYFGVYDLLCGVDCVDYCLEFVVVGGCIGVGDVVGIIVCVGVGIDQEVVQWLWYGVFQVGVMQYCGVFVEIDDVVVGQFIGVLVYCMVVCYVDFEFVGVGVEGGFGSVVVVYVEVLGLVY